MSLTHAMQSGNGWATYMSELNLALAISLGTSRITATTASIVQSDDNEIGANAPEALTLTMPAVAFIEEDGTVFVGDEAEARAPAHPERVIREFTRRIGDDVAITVADHFISPESVTALVARSVVDEVTRRAHAPSALAVTHPLSWSRHRVNRLDAALEREGMHGVTFIADPIAAAMHHAGTHEYRRGDRIAVYDLGGTSFDAVVLRHEGGGEFSVTGEPVHLHDLGGADFDDLLLGHVIANADADIVQMAEDSAHSREALAQLRRDVVRAKETLSSAGDARIPVPFSADGASVRITRAEFEAMIGERLEPTLDAFERALESAATEHADLKAILLTGGSARVPLVAQRMSERFDRLLAVGDNPGLTAVAGAAGSAAAAVATAAAREGDSQLGALTLLTLDDKGAAASDDDAPAFRHPGQRRAVRAAFPLAIVTASGLLAGAMVLGSTTAAGNRTDLADSLGAFVVPAYSTPEAPASVATPSPEAAGSATEPDSPAPRVAPAPRSEPRDLLAERDPRRPSAPTRNTPTPPPSAPKPKPQTSTTPSTPPSPSAPAPSTSAPTPGETTTPPQTPTPTPTPPPASEPPATQPPPTQPPASEPPADPDPPADPPPSDPPPAEPTTPPPPPEPEPSPPGDTSPPPESTPAPEAI